MNVINGRIGVLVAVLLSFVFNLSASEPSPGYLELNGQDRYVKIPQSDDFAIPAGGTMTITLKVTLNASASLPRDQVYISSLVRNDLNITPNNSNFVGFEVSQTLYNEELYRPIINVRYENSSSLGLNADESCAVSPENTVHMVLIYDGLTKKFYGYFDGNEMTPGYFKSTLNFEIPNYEGVLFGARYTCVSDEAFDSDKIERFFNGKIHYVRFYREAFTKNDIKDDIDSKTPLSNKTVIAAYDFTDLSEGKVRDISGNGHDGVLMGTWPEYEPGIDEPIDERPIITIEQCNGGVVSVYLDDETKVTSGSRLDPDTELTIVANPEKGYKLQSISVNEQPINSDDEGAAKFTIAENSTVSAVFIKNDLEPQPVNPPEEESEIWPGSLMLNGVDRYLKIPHDDRFTIQTNGSQTICFNVALKEVGNARQTLIGSRSHQLNKSGQEEKGGIEIYIDESGLHGLYVYNKESKGGANHNAEAKCEKKDLQPNINSHVALVYDGNGKTVRLYVDGELKGEGPALDYTVPVFSDILVGCRYILDHETDDQVQYFANGTFDDIHIYTSALTPEQVKMDMDGQELPSSVGLIAAYDFREFKGREISDVSGNNHTAYMMGASWPEYMIQDTYPINFSATGGGTLTVTHGATELNSGESVPQNETITVKCIAETGNQLKSLTINGEEKTPDADGVLTVEVSGELTILAVFEPIPAEIKRYAVNVAPVEHATVVLSTDEGSIETGNELPEGTVIKINVTVDEGYELEGIYVNDVKIEGDEFTVDKVSTVSVKVVEKTPESYTVKYTVEGSGEVTATVDDTVFESGQTIVSGRILILDMSPNDGYILKSVTVNEEALTIGPNNRIEIAVDKAMEILISFTKIEKRFCTINIIKNDNVTVKLEDSISEIFHGSSIPEGSEVTVTAIPAEGYELEGIYVDGEKLEGNTFIVRDNCYIEAKVRPLAPKPIYAVEFRWEGNGAVEVLNSESAIESGNEVTEGTVLVIKANAADGWQLKSVTVNDSPQDISAATEFEIEVTSQVTIYAVFEPIETPIKNYTVTVGPSEHAAVILSTSDGVIESGAEVAEGTMVSVKVTVDEDYDLEGIYVNGTILTDNTFTVGDATTITVKVKEKPVYQVSFTTRGNGSISASVDETAIESGEYVRAGKTLVITLTPDEGYLLGEVTVNGESLKLGPENRIEIIVEKELEIIVTFSEIEKKFFDVKVVWNDHVTVKMRDAIGELSHNNSLQEGSEVTVTAIPAEGYELIGIFVNDVKLEGNTFIVRDNCYIEAKVRPLAPKPTYPVEFKWEGNGAVEVLNGESAIESGNEVTEGTVLVIKANAADGWQLKSVTVNDSPVDVSAATEFEIEVASRVTIYTVFEPIETPIKNYTVTVGPSEHAAVILSTSDGVIESGAEVAEGTMVSVKVTVDEDYDLEGIYVNGTLLTDNTFTVSEATTITVKVKEKPVYQVSFTTRGNGSIAASVDETAIESGESIRAGKTLVITLTPDEGYLLGEVTVNGDVLKLGPENRIEIIVEKELEIIVTFSEIEKKFFDVKVVWNDHVTVKMRDAIGELSHNNSLQEGSEVTVTAIPAEGYELIGIFVNDVKLEGNTFIVRGHCLVEARVQPLPQKYSVILNVDGQGTLDVLNGETAISSGEEIVEGTELTIKPTPAEGWTLTSLTVNGDAVVLSSDGIARFELTESIVIQAKFERRPEPEKRFVVKIVQPENGTITLSSGDSDVLSGAELAEGSEVIVSVAVAEGYRLEAILVNNHPIDGNSFVVSDDCTVSASLVPNQGIDDQTTYKLTYSYDGPGHILVTYNGEVVATGADVPSDALIRIRCIADMGAFLVELRVNGEATPTDYLGNAEISMTGDSEIEARFAMIGYQLVVNTYGDGRAEIYREIDTSGNPVGSKLTDGDKIAYGDRLHLFAIPEKDRILMSASVNNNGEAKELAVDKDFTPGKIERSHYVPIDVKGDLMLDLRFSRASSGLSAVSDDGTPIRYYNLRGIEIPADRLTPGVYIRVSGKNRQKILIR